MLKYLDNIALIGEDIPALAALRQKGKAAFAGFPDKKAEAYKYTPVSSCLKEEMFSKPAHCHTHQNGHCDCEQKHLPFDAYEILFCNGTLHEHFHYCDGLEVSSLLDAVTDHEIGKYLNKFELEKFPFAALNTAFLEQGIFLRVFKDIKKPIGLIYHTKQNGFENIHNIVVLEKNVNAEIIEVFEGENSISLTNVVNEFFVLQNATLTHYKWQNLSPQAVHIALNRVDIKADGKYQSYTLQTGSKLARDETHACLKEQNASAVVNAAYRLSAESLVDTTTDIEHLSPSTASNQIVRGVVDNQAHGVFQGKIHIAPNTFDVSGHQSHKALLLSDDAKIDVKPELEIFADDVQCSHGATSGDLSADELFYLQSRGIDEQTARTVLTSAFLKTAFEDIPNSDIKTFFEELLMG